jgi:hypothetical protein
MKYNGQIAQDYFVSKVLKGKRDGVFIEIGSNSPISINNTYNLEKLYNWRGLMVEYDINFLEEYKRTRPNSFYIMNDATKINYESVLTQLNFPNNIDYLQIDLEVDNRSTLTTLEIFDRDVFPKRKFAVVTFEHDIYRGDYFNTRQLSREIFKKHGYYCVYPDIGSPTLQGDGGPAYHFEDWYVHPDLVDMDYIKSIQRHDIHDVNKLLELW